MTTSERQFADTLATLCKTTLQEVEITQMLGIMRMVEDMLLRAHNTARGLDSGGRN